MAGILDDLDKKPIGLLGGDLWGTRSYAALLDEIATRIEPTIYKPGEKVPWSGIYKVVHDTVHRAEHEVTCVKDEVFPTCSHCGRHPRFMLIRAAHHIRNHDWF